LSAPKSCASNAITRSRISSSDAGDVEAFADSVAIAVPCAVPGNAGGDVASELAAAPVPAVDDTTGVAAPELVVGVDADSAEFGSRLAMGGFVVKVCVVCC